MTYFDITAMTGWLLQPKLGANAWYAIEIPGGYERGQPFPEEAIWHEYPTKDDARHYVLGRLSQADPEGQTKSNDIPAVPGRLLRVAAWDGDDE